MASRSWNRVELIGNLTRDPEVRYTPNGAAVATFSIATNRSYVSEGERKEEVDFHRVVAWNKLAELCQQLLKKGNRVFVSGRLQNRTWEQDGQNRNITEIVLEDMILLTSRSVGEAGESFTEELPSRQVDSAPVSKSDKKEEKSEPEKSDKQSLRSDDLKVPQEDPGNLDDLPF